MKKNPSRLQQTLPEVLHGAANGARTRDPQLGKLMLYQLSYCRVMGCKVSTFLDSHKME